MARKRKIMNTGQYGAYFGLEMSCYCGEESERHTLMVHRLENGQPGAIRMRCSIGRSEADAALRLGSSLPTCWSALGTLQRVFNGQTKVLDTDMHTHHLQELVDNCYSLRNERREKGPFNLRLKPARLRLVELLQKWALPQLGELLHVFPRDLVLREEKQRLFLLHLSVPLYWRRLSPTETALGDWMLTNLAETSGSEVAKRAVKYHKVAAVLLKQPAKYARRELPKEIP